MQADLRRGALDYASEGLTIMLIIPERLSAGGQAEGQSLSCLPQAAVLHFFIFVYIYLIAIWYKACKMVTVQSQFCEWVLNSYQCRAVTLVTDKKGMSDYERKITALYVGQIRV